MSVFDRLVSSKRTDAPILTIYGGPGTGKTSFALEFPDPIYFYVEGEEPPEGAAEVPADEITSLDGLLGNFSDLLTEEHSIKTVVIDSLDKVEPMVWAATMARNGWDTIDSNDKGSPTAFGKGYLAADVEWKDYFAAVSALSRAGITVIQILHSEAKTFKDPLVDDYDHYRPKLQKRALDLVIENCKALLFLNRRTSVKMVKAFGGKEQQKPQGMSGSERVIHTDGRAGFLAKNRLKNVPASITYKLGNGYNEISKYFGDGPSNQNEPEPQEDEAA